MSSSLLLPSGSDVELNVNLEDSPCVSLSDAETNIDVSTSLRPMEEEVSPFERLRLEWVLFRAQWKKFALCGLYLLYFCTMVFRNLAFYRFVPGPRMKDLGYELISKIADDAWYGDVPMYFVSSFLCLMSLMSLLGNGKVVLVQYHQTNGLNLQHREFSSTLVSVNHVHDDLTRRELQGSNGEKTVNVWEVLRKPFVVNMLYRYLGMLCIGHTLRFCTYIVTNPSGTADHCMPDLSNSTLPIDPPKNLYEVFFTRLMLKPSNNCGDLMFSGHMLQIITPVLMIYKYGEKCFQYQRFYHYLLITFLVCMVGVQIIFIIGKRNHYTSDIVVGAYLTPLLWYFYCNELHKVDLDPSLVEKKEANHQNSY